MKRIFYALIALCAFMVVLPSCGNPNTPSNQGGNGGGSSKEKEFEVKGVTFKMIEVKGGTFTMGALPNDEEAYDNEKPAHSVTVSDFSIGETEVTQLLWQAVMENNPSEFKGANRPVEKVSWEDCQEFIDKLNSLLMEQLKGKLFRLPTEAEWEFAARGGNKSKGYLYSGSNTLADVAWFDENSDGQTQSVGSLKPNELGIYDMSGNVSEWCSDWYDPDYYSESPSNNPQGPSRGDYRVYRGGSWNRGARGCRSSYRHDNVANQRYNSLGLRLALSE